jgi:hypothetical protein
MVDTVASRDHMIGTGQEKCLNLTLVARNRPLKRMIKTGHTLAQACYGCEACGFESRVPISLS